MTKISVVTRTKDRPLFLSRAITDVSKQTYKDYEHIIVNDGGDKSEIESIVDGFEEEIRGKIKLFHRDKASGAPDTILSESVDYGDSEYVAIHDDDDTWHPEMLHRVVELLDSGSDGVAVRTDNVYEKVKDGKIIKIKQDRFMPDLRSISLYDQCLDNQLTTVCFVYRRSAYEAAGKYDSSLPVVGDWEFGIRFLRSYDVDYLDPGFALAFYHRRADRTTSFAQYDHRTYLTKVLNKYLRADLESGSIGIGYIMNDLRYEQDMITKNIRKLLPASIVKLIRKKVRS